MDKVDSLENMGCFCFTEVGYGNNAVEMETTARYDSLTKQFTIDSPTPLSHKYWITNGAKHSNYAVVFAQTIVDGKNEGVNVFIVRIRNERMEPCPGVEIEDMGFKIGLNGVDNARLAFNNVKIPRENMLNRLNDVDENGVFKSDIKKRAQRFFKATDRLLSGRLCIAAMSLSGTKINLYHAIKYSQRRLAVGPTGLSDTPIFNYQLQQNALLPLVARTFVITCGYNYGKQIFCNPSGKEHEFIALICAIKCLAGWNT